MLVPHDASIKGDYSMRLLLRQATADQLGIHFSRLERLRLAGLIPEAVRVGHYYCFPADRIDAIRKRLTASGHLRPLETAGA